MRTTKQDSAAEDNKAVFVGSCHGFGLSISSEQSRLPLNQHVRTDVTANGLKGVSIVLRSLADLQYPL